MKKKIILSEAGRRKVKMFARKMREEGKLVAYMDEKIAEMDKELAVLFETPLEYYHSSEVLKESREWLRKYYPVPARIVPLKYGTVYSLKKWRGLQKEALATHGLSLSPNRKNIVLTEGGRVAIMIHGGTCPLCVAYPTCGGCPIVAMRGVPCDSATAPNHSPYSLFSVLGNPEPMIELLEDTIIMEDLSC